MMREPPVFQRSPRLIRRPPSDAVTIPVPPVLPVAPENPMMTVLIPLTSALVIVIVVLLTGIGAAWWPGLLIGLVGATMAALGALGNHLVRLRAYRRSRTERIQRFHGEIAHLESQLSQLQDQQRTLSINNDPSPENCLAIVQRRLRHPAEFCVADRASAGFGGPPRPQHGTVLRGGRLR